MPQNPKLSPSPLCTSPSNKIRPLPAATVCSENNRKLSYNFHTLMAQGNNNCVIAEKS